MTEILKTIFSSDGFMPHGHCYLWQPGVLWLHILSDALIALAYYSIPFSLVSFIRQRRDIPFNWIFLCFAIFIIACGTTHLMEIWVIWHPTYWLSGLVKAITALVSVPTAFLLMRLVPHAVALPSPAALRTANAELEREIIERKRAEENVTVLNNELEQRVLERTRQLEAANETLAREIRERLRAEAEVRELNAELELRVASRTAELEAANRELEAFSYSVSHDLRAPLRAVGGFAAIVLDDYGVQLPQEGRNYLQRVRDGGIQMEKLIDGLLAFARLNRQPVARKKIDTAKLVREVLDEAFSVDKGRQIDIHLGQLPQCHGDPVLMKQVWVNLVSNAFKYTTGIQPARIEIGCEHKNGEEVFFVRDNGVGFDMNHASKLFGVFQRLHRPDEFDGTGVGLAIVQRIVHRHGGQVWAEAAPGRGATFYFRIAAE